MESGRGTLRKRPPGRKSEAALDWRPLFYRVKLAIRLLAHRVISLLLGGDGIGASTSFSS
jgi:hypothetical protein